ncbi:hypothetical protein THAOC_00096, partial [Thalassiosira oceanica]
MALCISSLPHMPAEPPGRRRVSACGGRGAPDRLGEVGRDAHHRDAEVLQHVDLVDPPLGRGDHRRDHGRRRVEEVAGEGVPLRRRHGDVRGGLGAGADRGPERPEDVVGRKRAVRAADFRVGRKVAPLLPGPPP